MLTDSYVIDALWPVREPGRGSRAGDEVLYSSASQGLCAYYRSMQEYYAIRALQCAYSVCYPLTPWYGYWAQYYENLAQSVCGDE